MLQVLSDDIYNAVQMFIDLHTNMESENFHITDNKKLTDEQVHRRIISVLDGLDPKDIGNR